MSSYVEWIAVAALAMAVTALVVSVSEARMRQRRDKESLASYEAMQAIEPAAIDPELAAFQEKWEQKIQVASMDPADAAHAAARSPGKKATFDEALREAVYQPVPESVRDRQYRRP